MVEERRGANAEGKAYLYQQFDRLGLPCVPTQANFVFVDLGVDVAAAFEALLERGVTVRIAKGAWPDGHVRVTIGTRWENERFIAALEETLAELEAAGEAGEKP
jgi:histidinol-phosphate aminotransferase